MLEEQPSARIGPHYRASSGRRARGAFRFIDTSSTLYATDHTVLSSTTEAFSEIDLATGYVTRTVAHPKLYASQFVPLSDGKLLVVGWYDDVATVGLVDPKTLAYTPIKVPATADPGHYVRGGAAVLPDGTIAVTGHGMGVEILDPKSWTVTKELAPEHDWSSPVVANGSLYADLKGELHVFDLERGTHEHASAEKLTGELQAAGPALGYREDYSTDAHIALQVAGKPSSIKPDEDAFAFDAAGDHVLYLEGGVAHVRAFAGGADRTFDLGASARGQTTIGLALTEHTAIIFTGPILRVIDLAHGTVTDPGLPPYTFANVLAVTPDGNVFAAGNEAWTIRDGAVTSSVPLHGAKAMPGVQPNGHYGVIVEGKGEDSDSLELHAIGAPAPLSQAPIGKPFIITGWLGKSDSAVFATVEELAWFVGGAATTIAHITVEAFVADVDQTNDVALVTAGGTAHQIQLSSGAVAEVAFKTPGCDEYASGVVEPGGSRVALWDDQLVYVYDRTKGTLIAAATFPDSVYDVSFVPGHPEVIVATDKQVGLWVPGQPTAKLAASERIYESAISDKADRLAFSYADGRVALVDYAKFSAGLPTVKLASAKVPDTCPDPGVIDPDATGDGDTDDGGFDDGDSSDDSSDDSAPEEPQGD